MRRGLADAVRTEYAAKPLSTATLIDSIDLVGEV
jgi:hypothetical protein